MIQQQETDKIRTMFASAKKVAIVTHMSPDGDAMGSSLGMKHFIAAGHQQSAISNQPSAFNCLLSVERVHVIVPNAFPDFLAWLPGADEIVIYENEAAKANTLLEEADMIICTDFNEPKRIGALGQKLLDVLETKGNAVNVLMIDHHLMVADRTLPEAENVVKIIDSASPSASQLVYQVATGVQPEIISLDFATCIYTGMMTDTGNFSFNSNYPELYEIIAKLVAAGVDKDAIYNKVFNSWSEGRMRLVGYCLDRKMRIFPESHAALIYLSGKELYRFNFKSGDAEGIVNMPLSIKDIHYSCFMREDKVTDAEKPFANGSKKKIKISMRSQGDRPVNVFCREVFNGGGHKNASGGEYYGALEDAVKLFLENYQQYFCC